MHYRNSVLVLLQQKIVQVVRSLEWQPVLVIQNHLLRMLVLTKIG
jgi:hypothetical protein